MDRFGLPDADVVEKFIKLILSIPGTVLDYIFQAFSVIGFDFPAPAKLLLLLIFSAGSLFICFRHRRSFWAWPIGLYALLLTSASIFQLFVIIWTLLFAPKLEVSGEIRVIERTVISSQEKVGGDWRSNDCGVVANREIQRCSARGVALSPPFNVHIKSANCGSNVENVRLDPSNSSCLLVRERLTGCGYNKIFGIKDCKGRGWLDYDVFTSSEQKSQKIIGSTSVSGKFNARDPFVFEIPVPAGVDSSMIFYEYNVNIKKIDGTIVNLTSDKPSTENIQSVAANKIFKISINASDRVAE